VSVTQDMNGTNKSSKHHAVLAYSVGIDIVSLNGTYAAMLVASSAADVVH
jgi:hypothetical protein